MDDIVQDFAEHMEVDFLHMNIEDEVHTRSLQDGLIRLSSQKCRLEILWNQNLLGRNVFDEMMNAGILHHHGELAQRLAHADLLRLTHGQGAEVRAQRQERGAVHA